ncbi:MAG: hypothetical protein ACI3T9_04980 [Romboutsia timonensis]
MKLLLEKSLLDNQNLLTDDKFIKLLKRVDNKIDIDKQPLTPEYAQQLYSIMDNHQKIEFVSHVIHKYPGYWRIKDAESSIMDSLLQYGFDDEDNKLLKFMSKANVDLNDTYVGTINNLLNNNTIKSNIGWLYDKAVYQGKPDEIDYKIKALAFLSDKSNLSKYNIDPKSDQAKELSPDNLKTKSAQEIKDILSGITRETSTDEFESTDWKGTSVIKRKLGLESDAKLSIKNITDYILSIDSPEVAKKLVREYKLKIQLFLDEPILDDGLKKILTKNYKPDNDIDGAPEEALNYSIAKYLNDHIE